MKPVHQKEVTNFNAVVAGQGGDGSLTVVNVLAELLTRKGYHMYQSRDVASRIKGGIAAAMLRGSIPPRGCMGDKIDLLVSFDRDALMKYLPDMGLEGIVIFDSSDGPLDHSTIPEYLRIYEIPFGRFAVRELRRDLFKNSLSFGILARILSVENELAEKCLRHVLRRLPDRIVISNVKAFNLGLEFASNADLAEGEGPWRLIQADSEKRMLIGGNEALAMGFTVAGGRFFAGYPITPASEILDWLQRNLPAFGGIALQAEDELGAINMALGAAMTGTRTMTATSSPGFALMLEGITQAGAAEIPLVIVNSQRAGPSTGMPTKPEQSDIGMMVYGGNGEFPRVILSPGTPQDCFEIGVLATNLAQKLQGPVMVALDQAVAQDTRTVVPFDLSTVRVEKGKRLDASSVSALDEYKRYELTDDGISPWAVPGTPAGMNLMTGNERNEWGLVSTEPKNRRAMMDKRMRKIAAVIHELPRARTWGREDAGIGILGMGLECGVIEEAVERLTKADLIVRGMQPRTLWPVLDETLEFINSCQIVYLVEHSHQGLLQQLLMSQGASKGKFRPCRYFDGIPARVGDLVAFIRECEGVDAAAPEKEMTPV